MKGPLFPIAIRNPLAPWAILGALIVLVILTPAAARGEGPSADAVNVFHCTFGQEWDVDYDSWPDRWIRKTGIGFPHYVNVEIHDDHTAPGKRCLRIDLDGAAAAVVSPPIRVLPRFSYVFEAQVKNEQLIRSTVVLTLDFCDKAGRVLETRRSAPVGVTKDWRAIQIDHVEPSDPDIDRVVLGLEVIRGAKGDLNGRVSLADVRLARLPRIAVSTNNPCNVYTSLSDVVVSCELSGIPERDPEIRFQLFDARNNPLQSEDHRLDGRLIVEADSEQVADGVRQIPEGFEGTTSWQPKIPDYGYYRIKVRMLTARPADGQSGEQRELASRDIFLAVVPPLSMPRGGEFGWSLPGDCPLSYADLNKLLPQVGVNWVKAPVWFDAQDAHRAEALIRFVELLSASNIEVVGIIDQPPGSDANAKSFRGATIAELLSSDSSAWAAMLEPVMARLSLRVRWWQLGRDGDISFVGFPNLSKRIEDVRTALFRFGQDVRIGVCWDWASLNASGKNIAWDFEQLVSEEPPTETQFAQLLASPRENKALRWITLDVPSRPEESTLSEEEQLLARSGELVRRMVTAKMNGANAIFVSDAFDDSRGLMRATGMPNELLLPWRTTAVMLGGATYLGEMQLPGNSENRIFQRPDGQLVMVVWNRKPIEEKLYLGEIVKQYDLFGRSKALQHVENEQTFPVGPTPSFVVGLHEAITRWRMAVEFEKHQVPSIFAKPHPNSLRFRNFFPQGVGGSLKIVVLHQRPAEESAVAATPPGDASGFLLERWNIEPPHAAFQLAADAEMKFPFEIELRNALFGRQPVRIDFRIEADQEYVFSVYRELEVGTEDLTLEVNSYIDHDGSLIVEQLMTNKSEQLADFKCFLRAKGHRRQRMQVYRLGSELDRKLYRFGNGRELVGREMLLEIEELNGPRELRYRFVAQDAPPPTPENAPGSGAPPEKSPPAPPVSNEVVQASQARS